MTDAHDQENAPNDDPHRFLARVAEGRTGLLPDLVALMMRNKKWWMVPIILCVLGLGVLVILGATGAAPFIYTLF
jgi:hypothetical protein